MSNEKYSKEAVVVNLNRVLPVRTLEYFLDCIKSGRLGVSWIAGFAAGTTVFVADSGGFLLAALVAVCMTMLTMAGFISNDISDRQKDKIAQKSRPITTGKLPAKVAALFAICLFAFVVFVSGFLGIAAVVASILTAAALVFYSAFSKKFPLFKGVYTALLCIVPFGFAAAASEASVQPDLVSIVFFFIVFREILLDTLDASGDRAFGLKTVAHVLGEQNARTVGWLGMFGSLMAGQVLLHNPVSILVLYLALISLAVSACLYLSNEEKGLRSTRLAMFLGVFSIAVA
nr:UbiA family prenyltransferase [Thalassobius sp. Cn5-15]